MTALAYARAMAMPTISGWEKIVSTAGVSQYYLEFEGRDYRILRSIFGGYNVHYWIVGTNEHVKYLDSKGKAVEYTYSHNFSTPQKAIAAARKFSAIAGWP